MDYLYYDPKYVPNDAFGLLNFGNICWWNSVIQALLSCSQLNQYLLENAEKFTENNIALEYIKLIRAALSGSRDDINSISKSLLTTILADKSISTAIKLNLGSQNDAVEGIMALFNVLKSKDVEQLFFHRHITSSLCLLCKRVSYENKTEDPNIPYFIQLSETNTSNFIDILLCNWSTTDGIKCNKCQEQSNKAILIYKLVMTREILMIVIKNTNESYNRFKYPYLEFISLPTFDDKQLKYRHIATINHHGGRIWAGRSSSSSGHYTATCYRGDKNYWNTNDSSVATSKEFTQTSSAYVLFYSLVE